MIPTRNFPYTDYHDLNLDWLLKHISEIDIDLEDLKRRIKILEDWRIVIDGDIITINNTIDDHSRRIANIEGDIITINNTIDDHSRRITNIEGDITTILNNSTTFYIDLDDITKVKAGSLDGAVIDISDVSNFRSFVSKIGGTISPEIGGINYNIYVVDEDENINTATMKISLDGDADIIVHKSNIIGNSLKTLNYYEDTIISYIVNNNNITAFINVYKGSPVHGRIIDTLQQESWIPSNDTEYPYKYILDRLVYSNLTVSDEVRIYFEDFTDFKDYSDTMSQYVEIVNHTLVIYSKNIPDKNIRLNIFVNYSN